jgi:hypothetical protein
MGITKAKGNQEERSRVCGSHGMAELTESGAEAKEIDPAGSHSGAAKSDAVLGTASLNRML